MSPTQTPPRDCIPEAERRLRRLFFFFEAPLRGDGALLRQRDRLPRLRHRLPGHPLEEGRRGGRRKRGGEVSFEFCR